MTEKTLEPMDIGISNERAWEVLRRARLIRYEHGGGRFAVIDDRQEHQQRELVADFYSEDTRELIFKLVQNAIEAHEKTPEPMNTRSFGVVMALSQLGEQPELAALGEAGAVIKRLIADSRAIVAETGTPAPHSVEDDFQHWLSYSGVGSASEADLRAAYFAGAGAAENGE
jgi:hypothetical protein